MNFFQEDIVQTNFVQHTVVESPTVTSHFRVYPFLSSLQEQTVLGEWIDSMSLPSFDYTKASADLVNLGSLGLLKSKHRDLNIVQTSSAIFDVSMWEDARQRTIIANLKLEVNRCLKQAFTVVYSHTQYKKALIVTVGETARIFIAGELNRKQLTVESEAKDRLWNLRIMEYGCKVMASILPGMVWVVKQQKKKNEIQKFMSLMNYTYIGTRLGMQVGGAYGAVIGAIVGFVIGLAIEYEVFD